MEDKPDILEMFRQAIKGGVDRLGQQFSPYSEEERQANMNQQPNMPGYSARYGNVVESSNNPHTRTDWQGADAGPGVDPTFAQRQYPGREGIADNFRDMQQVNGSLAETFAPQRARPNGFPGVDRVLMKEQMRRRDRTMPGSPVNY